MKDNKLEFKKLYKQMKMLQGAGIIDRQSEIEYREKLDTLWDSFGYKEQEEMKNWTASENCDHCDE